MTKQQTTVGFIGLGHMGKPMARNLLQAGFPVVAHNRSRAPVEEVAKDGAQPAFSPREVAERSDIVITMLPDSPDVELVVLGADGVIEGAKADQVVVDMSTILPRSSRDIAARLADKGAAMLDAPVSGGPQGAEAATLSIMVGGPKDAFDRCLPVLQAMGKQIVYMGESGSGSMAKLCNQVACVLNLLGVSETLVLARKAGLDPERLLEAITAGAASSWMLNIQGPKMVARDFAPGFFVRLQQKDLRLVLSTAEELGLPLPGTALVQQLFRALEASGEAELGTQALIKAVERLAAMP
ncbi:MAG: NAD(P)-dependent oxidoreductase [Armatimonadota bacterium]|nr:MAG: NAD(P)-dependent oxidoreductase [Armatimonadota bacterium]